MYAKKMLSAVAALAVISTGAMAFETDNNFQVLINDNGMKTAATYKSLNDLPTIAASALELSANLKGDALIYPVFTQKKNLATSGDASGWETEIVVRNITDKGTIAKVALFEQHASKEVLDFNIFLTPYDTFKFKIANGKVTTTDGSIILRTNWPNDGILSNGVYKDSITMNTSADNNQLLEIAPLSQDEVEAGYVVIYGMAQHETPMNYHGQTQTLAEDYYQLLDNCRTGWRNAYTFNGMVMGTMAFSDPISPTLPNKCADLGTPVNGVSGINLNGFGDVDANTLVGTVSISNSADAGHERDMVLNATALKNFSDDNMMVWAPGEFADFADRGLQGNSYSELDVLGVAEAFLVQDAYYTFRADDVKNSLLVTQPMKRILMQMGLGTKAGINYWVDTSSKGWDWGGFTADISIFNESECKYMNATGSTRITSPFGIAGMTSTYNFELEALNDLQDVTKDSSCFYKDGKLITDGYVSVKFKGNSVDGLPAIVTQMVGSKVNGIAQTNWIYAPVSRVTDTK